MFNPFIKPMINKSNKSTSGAVCGFTQIELLIVLILITLIFSLITLSINPVEKQAQARDNKRMSDLNTLDRAINEYLLDYEFYPDTIDTLRLSTALPAGATQLTDAQTGWILADFKQYTSKLPIDPLNDDTYYYSYLHDESSYELNAVLESLTDYAINDDGNDPTRYEIGNNLMLISP